MFDYLVEDGNWEWVSNQWGNGLSDAKKWAQEAFPDLVAHESDIAKPFLQGIEDLINWDSLAKMLKSETGKK